MECSHEKMAAVVRLETMQLALPDRLQASAADLDSDVHPCSF